MILASLTSRPLQISLYQTLIIIINNYDGVVRTSCVKIHALVMIKLFYKATSSLLRVSNSNSDLIIINFHRIQQHRSVFTEELLILGLSYVIMHIITIEADRFLNIPNIIIIHHHHHFKF